MMSIIAYIANIFRGELGSGKRNSSFFIIVYPFDSAFIWG